MSEVQKEREQLVRKFFPQGIPKLWCAAITHYSGAAAIDAERTEKHFRFLSAYAGGVLSPSTTGDGWLMTDDEILRLLDVQIDNALRYRVKVLVGVLKTTAEEAVASIRRIVAHVEKRTGLSGPEALLAAGLCGFALCPPKGAGLSQKELGEKLASVLRLGYPTVLYQLPQFTQNEMSSGLIAGFASEYPNFYLFKDTSGEDKVARSGADFKGLFLVRGAEGNYARWYKLGGGVYDGMLLSTVNSFPEEHSRILSLLSEGKKEEAQAVSDRLDACVGRLFKAAGTVAESNPFSNANKAVDHFNAYGADALRSPAPILHSGAPMPSGFLRSVHDILEEYGFLRRQGYLESGGRRD